MLGFLDLLQGLNLILIVLLAFAGIGLWTTLRFLRDLAARRLRRRDDLPHYVKAGGRYTAEEELNLALRRIEHLEDQLEFTDGLFRS